MAVLKAIPDKLRAIRDIGVLPEMSPDEAKYIRLINMLVLFTIPFNLLNTTFFLIGAIIKDWPWLIVGASILGLALSLPVLIFNKRGHYNLGRTYYVVILNAFIVYVCYLAGKGFLGHYMFFAVAGIAAIIYPKDETRSMIAMISLSIVLYFIITQVFYDYLGGKADASDPTVLLINFHTENFIFAMIIVVTLIARSSAIGAEERLKEEREKVTRLSEKIKVYLPHQFVDALSKGDAEAGADYRRRRLTVFFSDVEGFTKWTDKLEPEEVHEILNQYLSEMSAIAHRHGGTIDKFIGDSMMIFFGDPEYTNDRDHAIRCVRMAVEMQEKMAELRKEWEGIGYEEPLRIRVGINTGYATVGNFGSEDRLNYTALGSAVNLASRLETSCEPDKITVSHTTYSLIKDEIDCEPRGQIEAKGFAEPVKIYEVI